jgi:hypothetical protein
VNIAGINASIIYSKSQENNLTTKLQNIKVSVRRFL